MGRTALGLAWAWGRVVEVSAGRWKRSALALAMAAASSGCVERLIGDELADGGGGHGGGDTYDETDTNISDTHQVSTGQTTIDPDSTTDPDAECQVPEDCGDDQTCYQGVCVGTGSVRVSLSWNVVTDLDLHVLTPSGEWISYQNPLTNYGQLDVDDCVAGNCINQDGTHVENVFLDANAPRGTYGVMVVNFDGREGADYAVEVAGDVSAQYTGFLQSTEFFEGPVHEFTW